MSRGAINPFLNDGKGEILSTYQNNQFHKSRLLEREVLYKTILEVDSNRDINGIPFTTPLDKRLKIYIYSNPYLWSDINDVKVYRDEYSIDQLNDIAKFATKYLLVNFIDYVDIIAVTYDQLNSFLLRPAHKINTIIFKVFIQHPEATNGVFGQCNTSRPEAMIKQINFVGGWVSRISQLKLGPYQLNHELHLAHCILHEAFSHGFGRIIEAIYNSTGTSLRQTKYGDLSGHNPFWSHERDIDGLHSGTDVDELRKYYSKWIYNLPDLTKPQALLDWWNKITPDNKHFVDVLVAIVGEGIELLLDHADPFDEYLAIGRTISTDDKLYNSNWDKFVRLLKQMEPIFRQHAFAEIYCQKKKSPPFIFTN